MKTTGVRPVEFARSICSDVVGAGVTAILILLHHRLQVVVAPPRGPAMTGWHKLPDAVTRLEQASPARSASGLSRQSAPGGSPLMPATSRLSGEASAARAAPGPGSRVWACRCDPLALAFTLPSRHD